MDNQTTPSRHHVSECPLPAATAETYSISQVREAAEKLAREAGVTMLFSVFLSVSRHGAASLQVVGYDSSAERNPLDVPSVAVSADTLENLQSLLITKLNAWVTTGKELVCA